MLLWVIFPLLVTANVGLASADWGKVRFGRVNELTTETIRKFDPFYQYGVGGMIESTQRSARIDNTVRYDSPKWEGVSVGLSYSLGNDTENDQWYNNEDGREYSNDGYAINLSYDNGPWMATANWSRLADSNDSSTWNLGVAYKFGDARMMLSYEKTKDEGYDAGGSGKYDFPLSTLVGVQLPNGIVLPLALKSEQESWLLGLEWDIGPGQFDAAVQRVSLDEVRAVGASNLRVMSDADIMKYSVGYTYNLSKRTSVYGQVAYTDWDTKEANIFYGGNGQESTTAVQVGMTHKF